MLYQNKPFAQPRVIILDDDDLVGAALALLARDAGYDAVIFKSLSDANAEVEGISVHAIISDFDLGNGPNGVEAARALRAHRIPAPPALIVTAMRRRSVEAAAREAGFEVLSKPASPASLKRWLARNAPMPVSLIEAIRP